MAVRVSRSRGEQENVGEEYEEWSGARNWKTHWRGEGPARVSYR